MTRVKIATVAVVAAILCACGADNVGACKKTYEKINSLPCIPEASQLDVEASCPEAYNSTGYDYTDYFKCLEEGYECEPSDDPMYPDGIFYADVADCTVPTG